MMVGLAPPRTFPPSWTWDTGLVHEWWFTNRACMMRTMMTCRGCRWMRASTAWPRVSPRTSSRPSEWCTIWFSFEATSGFMFDCRSQVNSVEQPGVARRGLSSEFIISVRVDEEGRRSMLVLFCVPHGSLTNTPYEAVVASCPVC